MCAASRASASETRPPRHCIGPLARVSSAKFLAQNSLPRACTSPNPAALSADGVRDLLFVPPARVLGPIEYRIERLGYETSLWSSGRVADLIEQEFGVRYHPGHVWKILVSPGWSCQRPVGRALERNEGAIRYWKKATWPASKKSPKRRANDRLSGRKRTEPAAAPLPDPVAARPHTHAAIPLRLENGFGQWHLLP